MQIADELLLDAHPALALEIQRRTQVALLAVELVLPQEAVLAPVAPHLLRDARVGLRAEELGAGAPLRLVAGPVVVPELHAQGTVADGLGEGQEAEVAAVSVGLAAGMRPDSLGRHGGEVHRFRVFGDF